MNGSVRLSRRSIVYVAGALAAGGTGLAMATGRASAEINLQVESATFEEQDGSVYRPFVTAAGSWSFVRVDPAPDEWAVYLTIDGKGQNGNWQAIDVAEGQTSGHENSGTYGVRGAITAHSGWEQADFETDSEVTHTVPVRAMLVLRNSGDIITTATAETTAQLTVKNGGAALSLTGQGYLDAQENQDSATPTIPSPDGDGS